MWGKVGWLRHGEVVQDGRGCTCSLMRFRRAPVPTRTILDANSTPIVWDDKMRPVHDCAHISGRPGPQRRRMGSGGTCIHSSRIDAASMTWCSVPPGQTAICNREQCSVRRCRSHALLSAPARSKQDNLREVVVHTSKLLRACDEHIPHIPPPHMREAISHVADGEVVSHLIFAIHAAVRYRRRGRRRPLPYHCPLVRATTTRMRNSLSPPCLLRPLLSLAVQRILVLLLFREKGRRDIAQSGRP